MTFFLISFLMSLTLFNNPFFADGNGPQATDDPCEAVGCYRSAL